RPGLCGVIGRTASKYCVPDFGVGDAVLVSTVALGVVSAASLTVALGSADEAGVSLGDGFGVSFAADGDTVGVRVVFFFLRCFGVGIGRTKSLLNLSPSVSSCSSVARATPRVIAIATNANNRN